MGCRPWVVLLAAVLAGGCRSHSSPTPDASVDSRRADADVPRDAITTSLAVDLTLAGCPSFDPAPRCTGRAPLTVQFVPVTTGDVTKYLWTFGDGTAASSDRAPAHTYAFPGSYDVTLVGGGSGGSAARTRPGLVVVVTNHSGDPCDVDQQCDQGLTCICGAAGKCSAAFARGLCASTCATASCQAPDLCADLAPGNPDGGEAWQQSLCLRSCTTDGDCAPPLHCRDLPARADGGAWLRGCFPDYPAATGLPCRSPGGQLVDAVCVTGSCLDLGVRGACSLDCTTAPCPPGSACADIADGRHLCLARCGPDFACDRDPLLACAPPNPGPLGYALHPGAAPGSYCAPRRCATSDDCAPSGTCRLDATGGHCLRRPAGP
jgi:PKD repeat protein